MATPELTPEAEFWKRSKRRLRDPEPLSFGELSGKLWEEISEGTLIWREPTEAEKAASRERRRQIFADSRVPWILSDVAGLLQFWDDVQDILAFSVWNKKIIARQTAKGRCVRRLMQQTGDTLYTRAGANAKCSCQGSIRDRKRLPGGRRFGLGQLILFGPGLALIRFLPGVAPVMYALLAGQVLYSFFGVGLRLGPIVGAAVELWWRGLDAIGLPFGPEHNKYHQLKRARLLQRADKGFSSGRYLSWEERVGGVMALRLAGRDVRAPIVLRPSDYPTLEDLFSDPFGTIGDTMNLIGSLFPNAAAYVMGDLLGGFADDMARHWGGDGNTDWTTPNPAQLAMLRRQHLGKCGAGGACNEGLYDALLFGDFVQNERSGAIDLLYKGQWRDVLPEKRDTFDLTPEEVFARFS